MTVTVPPQAKRVRYVYIPADVHEEFQERDVEVPEGREVECLLDVLKDHFRRAGGTKTAAQREAHRQHLIQQVGPEAAGRLNEDLLSAALDMQMVESLPLLVNNPRSGYIGVNLYCDDQAAVKELANNPRASAIADCCGRTTQVRGDAFLGRLFDNDDAFVRLDFTLGEMSSTAPWVAAAAAQAAEKMRQGDRAADFMAKMQQQRQAQGRPSASVRELSPAEVEKEAGNAAVRAGDWATAVARYGTALDLNPGLTAANNNRALALLRLGRWGEAEADCCRVLAAEPTNVKALLRRAAARRELGRGREAEEDLRSVISVEPHNKEAAAELARLATTQPPPSATDLPSESVGAGSSGLKKDASSASGGQVPAAVETEAGGSEQGEGVQTAPVAAEC